MIPLAGNGEPMNNTFSIESRTSNGNLHLSPKGELDGSSACELTDFIGRHRPPGGRVFVNTDGLSRIVPFGSQVFRRRLAACSIGPEEMFLVGRKGYDLAPKGFRVLIPKPVSCKCRSAGKVERCCGGGKCGKNHAEGAC